MNNHRTYWQDEFCLKFDVHHFLITTSIFAMALNLTEVFWSVVLCQYCAEYLDRWSTKYDVQRIWKLTSQHSAPLHSLWQSWITKCGGGMRLNGGGIALPWSKYGIHIRVLENFHWISASSYSDIKFKARKIKLRFCINHILTSLTQDDVISLPTILDKSLGTQCYLWGFLRITHAQTLSNPTNKIGRVYPEFSRVSTLYRVRGRENCKIFSN